MANIDPTSTATQLATAYTSAAQSLITSQTKTAQTTSTALTKLQSALSAFDSALSGLSGTAAKSLTQYSATLAGTAGATASASSTAQPGSYSLFVEQVATAHQVAFEDLPAVPVSLGGPLVVKLADGSNFTVDLTAADQDGNGTISQTEIARAINQAGDNQGRVTAMTMTSGGKTQLVLSAGQTGAANAITLDTSGLPPSTLATALATPKELTAARDAIVWLGDQGTGLKIQQASNSVTAITGVTLTLTKAQAAGDTPSTLTVAGDASGTAANVQKFVDAYNTLEKALGDLTANNADATKRAAFASDSGVLALRNRLTSTLRQSFGGLRLADFGVTADRSGALSVNSTKLASAVAANPSGLDALFGNTGLTTSSGALGAFHSVVTAWTDSASGQLKQRQDSLQTQQKALTARQTRLDDQYNKAYSRYLAQFTQLQNLQSSMSNTSGLFANLGT